MSLKCGIVGLPNVGKSTLFNALTNSSKAQAENFPFCTIEPNIGVVPVPDKRLDKLSEISESKKKIYTTISFIDIATSLSNLLSGTGTIPIFGSIVQKGKFSAWALLEFVKALKSVDFPTFGNPTIPHLNPITYYLLYLKINLIFCQLKLK